MRFPVRPGRAAQRSGRLLALGSSRASVTAPDTTPLRSATREVLCQPAAACARLQVICFGGGARRGVKEKRELFLGVTRARVPSCWVLPRGGGWVGRGCAGRVAVIVGGPDTEVSSPPATTHRPPAHPAPPQTGAPVQEYQPGSLSASGATKRAPIHTALACALGPTQPCPNTVHMEAFSTSVFKGLV